MREINRIPFLDLVAPHEELKEELCCVFKSALETAGFVGGPVVDEFEKDFAKYCDTQYCIGVGSGTDALRFALLAAGTKEGDIVVTVPNTFIATTEAISQAGARPAFVDVDERTYNMDPEKLREYIENACSFDPNTGELRERRLRRRVSAVVPVHLYGQIADMGPILALAERYNLTVIEDACQAHGAEYFSRKENCWRRAGSMGMAAAFSFYPGKNLGACGEAGAVTTNNGTLAQIIRMLRDHGQAQKYFHEIEGYNGRLDSIQAAILQIKLRRLPSWNEARRQAASRYHDLFPADNVDYILPYVPKWARAIYHLYVIRSRNRDGLIKHLAQENIGAGIHYPVPLHLQNAYKSLGYKPGDFPIAEKIASEVLSLPMFPDLSADRQERVVHSLMTFAAQTEIAAELKSAIAAH